MNTTFQWLSQGVDLPSASLPSFDILERWIEAVATDHDRVAGELTYIFCDDEYIIDTNRRYLNHDYYTDIITFDYTRGRRLRGDMVISLDTVRTNAEAVGAPYERELLRVIIHGVLHLCGINDKGPGEREIMEQHEDAALAMLDKIIG